MRVVRGSPPADHIAVLSLADATDLCVVPCAACVESCRRGRRQQFGSAFPAQQGSRGRTGHESRSRRQSRPGPQGAHGRTPCRPTLGARVAATGNRVEVGPRGLDRRRGGHGGVLRTARNHPQSGFGGLRRPGVDGAPTRRPGRGGGVRRCVRRSRRHGPELQRPDGWYGESAGGTRIVAGLQPTAGHAPSILSTFQDWDQSADVAGLDSVAATGAIPMVTWSCGDSDANVVAGLDDATVTAEAQALAGTDVPILLRWFPDPNLTGVPTTASCLGSAGASGYIAAYQHIRTLFNAAGATNVAFVWSVDTSSGADNGFANDYPGGDSVDWVGADGDATSAPILRRRRSPRSSGHGIRPSRPPESP